MSSTVFRPAALAIAPTLAAILTASAGVMLLASGATPSEPTRFLLLLAFAPDLLIEISHFFSSILGLVLLLLAFGLRARLGAAWWAALIVLAASAVLAIFKGLNGKRRRCCRSASSPSSRSTTPSRARPP
jgi:glycosyltransferase 2 family protein